MVAITIMTTGILGIVTFPSRVHAAPVEVVADAPAYTKWLLDALKKVGENALLASITTALINTVTYAADRLAYDAAVFIASGGDGDSPLFENRTIGEYFADYGASVAADALGQIDESGILGNFSLCEPRLPEVTLAFKFGLQSAFQRPEPTCEFSEVQENWGAFRAEIQSASLTPNEENSLILTTLADAYNPKSNDFSVGILLYTDVLNKAQQDASLAAQRKLFGGFFEDKTDFITGRVETPAEVLQDNFRSAAEATDETRRQVALQALGDSNVLLQIGIHAGSVFTNTLLSKFTERLYSGLFGGLDQSEINPFDVNSLAATQDARETYRSFLTASVLSVENYSLLDDFSACPYVGKGLYNCVADASLIAAVSRADGGTALTIAEAIEEGLLQSSWPLIPSSDTARDQDMYCYTYGYCHGNLVKLRKARIISTGWELAAESTANSDASPVTLGEVVDGFYDCNEQNELDDNHPWCHLIDPNWVLKYPETQCKNQAYGQLLESSVSDQRKTECVDMPSCIDEDGDGNCTGGYGYCVREENVWNFRGEECPEYYGSCTSYENPEGDQVDFLSNTTDSGVCTGDAAGCLWYNTQKVSSDGETYDWPEYTDATVFAAAEAESDVYRNRIYFTSAVEDCAAEDGGCRELVSRENGTTLNMITNPSFEEDADENGVPDGWFVAGTGEAYNAGGESVFNGTDAINPGNSGIYYQGGIVLTPAAEYTLSFYAAQHTGVATSGVLLALEASNGEAIDFRGYRLDGDCAVDAANVNILQVTGTPSDSDYTRFSCTFTVPTLADSRAEITAIVDVMYADLWFDAIQLEQESTASEFHEEYSDAVLDLAYVKVPPTYLGCTGTASDPAECENYAGVCSEGDVGCSAYSPTNGDPAVMGIAGALDACPAECVGYDTFKQEPTRYEPAGDFPVYFIPDSAEQCTAQYVGCDEFTNITTEEPSYFTYVRACVTSEQASANASTSDAGAIFYTWEGSDTDGYQLKTWSLLESDMGNGTYTYSGSGGTDTAPNLAPCTSWLTNDTGITCQDDRDGDGTIDAETESCDEHDDTITNPDCREFYDTEGSIHYREWTDTVTVNDACVTYRKTTIVGADTATKMENCENSGGYFDDVTAQCRYYGYAEESFSCPAEESGCREYTGGRSRNSRQAFLEYFEDDALTQWDAVSATDVTLSNESIATDGHSLYSDNAPVWTYVGGDGSACADAGGCEPTAGTLGATCALVEGETYCGTLSDEVFTGKTYVVSFWAKGSGTLSVGFDTSRTSGTAVIDASFAAGTEAIVLSGDWQQYSFGPKYMDAATYSDFGNGASALVFSPGSRTSFYIDNVVLREGEDNIDVIQNSWVTPASCDETESGVAEPQYMLGCQEYTDQDGDIANLKSFTELCDESKVGCQAYFMTQESDSVGGAVYGAVCATLDGLPVSEATSCYMAQNDAGTAYDTASQYLCTIGVARSSCEFNLDWYVPVADLASHVSYRASTVVSPADRDVFLVVTNDSECSSTVAGCMEVGLPIFTQDHTAVESWETTYLMNVPEDYSSTLCSQDELFCQEWTDNDGNISYFKDPQEQTCEYRSSVTVSGVTYNGWFKTGTDELCDPEYVIGGDESGIWRNGDDDYAGWVGTCLAQYDSCSEFQDISDIATNDLYGNADGTSYFYMNNDALEENSLPDSQKCNGEVSQTDGCGIFNDTSDPNKTASATATYIASAHADELFGAQPNDFVNPIDCEGDSTIVEPDGDIVDLCNNRCVYPPETYYDISGSTGEVVMDGSCYSHEDCRPLTSESGETVKGSCVTNFAAARLENDSNTVLKVNRDRECSEWLSCSDSLSTWDERTNSYVNICGDIGLCTQYSGTSDASFCSEWKVSGAAVKLDITAYASRDVSWYGDDYSGFAIPNMLPTDQLTQVNVAEPMVCDTAESGTLEYSQHHGEACETDADCGSSGTTNLYCKTNEVEDYRLAYVAGSCEGYDYNAACSVGYCENTGSACINTEACGTEGGECLIGSCYAVSETLCASSADCSSEQECLSGYCATNSGDAAMADYTAADPDLACASGETLYPSVHFKNGTCLYGQCILTPDGSTFDVDTSETMACRAYPEINSPFENAIVEVWQDPTDYSVPTEDGRTITETNITDLDALPISFVQNFENVQTCAWGEDCSCSYKKVSYGDGAEIRYFGDDVNEDDLGFGICTTGLVGSFCQNDDECGGGLCEFPNQIDDALGLNGYCLERDSSTNILGDRDLRACLTWLPVDQLVGATDLYAKYTEAGYFAETNYCAYVGAYADLKPSIANGADISGDNWSFGKGAEILCAGGTDSRDGNRYCQDDPLSMTCPAGYFAVVGPRWDGSEYDGDEGKDTFTFTCSKDGFRNDCPYICVPHGAISEETGESCEPEGVLARYETDHDGWNNEHPGTGEAYDYTYAVYTTDDAYEFTEYAVAAQSCKAYGRQITNTDQETIPLVATVLDESVDPLTMSLAADSTPYGVQDSATQANVYMACSTVFSTMTSMYDNGAAPYTDRILNTTQSPEYTINAAETTEVYFRPQNFAYTVETLQSPFGASALASAINTLDDPRPVRLPSCKSEPTAGSDGAMEYIYFSPTVDLGCDEGAVQDDTTSFANPEGRAFTDYYFTLGRLEEFDGAENMTPGRVHQVFSETYVVAGPGTYNCLSNPGEAGSTLCAVGLVSDVFAHGRGGIRFYDGVYDRENDLVLSQDDWTDGSYEEIDVDAEDENLFEYDRRATDGNAPSVWALDLNNCYNDICEEDEEHALTLNEQNEGDVEANAFYRAYLKFYAAADKNQLPLRRIIVDWGDGSTPTGSTADNNYYKNHRGLEDGTEVSICDKPTSDSDYEWGMSPESCDQNYFSYNHIYTCNPSQMPATCADTSGDGIYDNTPCTIDETQCVYRPRVHIRDNWGLCTGTCDSTWSSTNGDNGPECVDLGDFENMNNTENANECAYTAFTGNTTNTLDSATNPWVYYDGIITVTP